MKIKVFSIYDSKADTYGLPFFKHATPIASREFGDLVNNPDSQVCKHPADYTLFELGTYNDSTGKLVNHPSAINLGNGVEFIIDTPGMPMPKLQGI